VFRQWVHQHETWRTFVFDLLARRMTAVLALVDEVLFQRMDSRVASFLTDRSRAGNPIRVTHQEIAAELGSSREVISRILEGFAGAGVIRAARGQVEVVDQPSLVARSTR
jgi:CRP/FNR family transcriptional regulator